MEYSSKDFGKTKSVLAVEMGDKLIHQQVCRENPDDVFSAERKHPVHIVDLPSKTMSMTIGGLAPGQSTNKHRHTYETIIYVLEGEGYSWIEDQRVAWCAGDAVYVPVWAWHSHHNTSEQDCTYVACENAPLLQNLGVALREESL